MLLNTSKIENILFPVLPLRNTVFFPKTYLVICAVRQISINAVKAAIEQGKYKNFDPETIQKGVNEQTQFDFDTQNRVILVAQRDGNVDNPSASSLFSVGVLSKITQITQLLDDTYMLAFEGLERVRIEEWVETKHYISATCSEIQSINTETQADNREAQFKSLISSFQEYAITQNRYSQEFLDSLTVMQDIEKVVNGIAVNLPIKVAIKQKILEEEDLKSQINMLLTQIAHESYISEIEDKIKTQVRKQVADTQRNALKDQLQALQKEINLDAGDDEISILEKKLKECKLTEEARKQVNAELNRLKSMSPMSSEALVSKSYLQCVSEIPWETYSELNKDISKAKKIMDDQYFGLDKVKREILRTIALYNRNDKSQGKILCFLGPPGTGKTSLAKLIAEATGRSFYRISLGGMKDEGEIRGHRRTYIGSMPGKLISALKLSKSLNPLILLDEISRISKDYKGDPESALLEVLDPEQNTTFRDNYVDIPVDLSSIMFVATTNSLEMAKPLIDRLKIIELPGYTIAEKKSIALDHIIPNMMSKYKLSQDNFAINEECISILIRFYTRQEMGVRGLIQSIEDICSEAALRIEESFSSAEKINKIVIQGDADIRNFLNRPRYPDASKNTKDQIGVSNGLGWSEVGGSVLLIETVTIPFKEQLTITGNLEKVMRESVLICKNLIMHRAEQYGIDPKFFDNFTISVNTQEASIKKDGPSAGIAIFCSILSAMTGKKLNHKVAMTGEITLTGEVLPVGGLKEKLLAAYYEEIKTVMIPKQNEDIIEDLPQEVKENVRIVCVSTIDQVIAEAFAESFSVHTDNILKIN